MERYIRQIQLPELGEEGQRRLQRARVAVVGVGALGCASANALARAGVGFIRLIDDDVVTISNLQRQILYTEEDARAGRYKARAAAEQLRQINAEITVEPHVLRMTAKNVDALLADVDLVVDGSDNFEVRTLINEFCIAAQKPWIYGGVVGMRGMTMPFLPGGPCLRCLMGGDAPAKGEYDTAATAGILATLPVIISALQCTEAIKILIGGKPVRQALLSIDIWEHEFRQIYVVRNPYCKACVKREFIYYRKKVATYEDWSSQ